MSLKHEPASEPLHISVKASVCAKERQVPCRGFGTCEQGESERENERASERERARGSE